MRYVRSDSVVSRVIAGETLIVPIRRGVGDLASIYSLNEIATAIWSAIAECDDWAPFEAKVAAIRRMGEAMDQDRPRSA